MADENAVQQIAEAIGYAEGVYQIGSRPQRNNNPGDLTVDVAGGARAVGMDGPFMIYATLEDGWDDLRQLVRTMLDNTSRIYNRDMTILQIAREYTSTQQVEWAQNVANRLGVSLDTRLSDVIPAAVGGGALILGMVALYFWRRKG